MLSCWVDFNVTFSWEATCLKHLLLIANLLPLNISSEAASHPDETPAVHFDTSWWYRIWLGIKVKRHPGALVFTPK